ncbi:hypothetical protein MJO29_003623 [Puccinia striiformis f. sp. tritici]|uniref:hypothetical protein n=1 Tax=Puccinia striiformis f. sp. tritici TaxID=168172 RepID=UPI00200867ED|nr:hypothetical protein Pst134EA_006726 [Puccinia striiformis f. sp. tritici]KAH9469436.1 hypothetical protein Pst134EA_006726 [Puccinia striiformis f. sp. tritici]KAI7963196.1 hypothetical protein MJO29_003623 [Puccinia striiformis f. sp. tritici]
MAPKKPPPVLGCPPSLLDKVDELRKLGLQDMVSLPQIAVVGDQSSGKSTLLEYISGVTFPKDAGMCTCFATEVSMRPSTQFSARVFINHQPDSRIKQPRSPEDVAGVIQQAKKLFVEASGQKAIYDDILTVELNGPGLPILTLVDLPGYIHTHATGQPESIVKDIEQLVERYLNSPRTVIMAVIPVNRDFETNVAIKHIRRFDPSGKRTLCVLTKPDQVDAGTERNVLDVLAGKKMHLDRGYHIIKNKNFEECQAGDNREATSKKEGHFFARSPWSSISPTEKGIASLVDRLSDTLNAQVEKEFPGIKKEIKKMQEKLAQQLDSLGPVVGSDLEKSILLQKNITRIMQQIKYLVDGHYSSSQTSRKFYIRARVQTLNRKFYQQILSLTSASVQSLNVSKIIKESRGRELRGMIQFEPFVILCRQVIKKWSEPTTNHITAICQLVESISRLVIEKECEKILVEHFLGRMIEFIDDQQKKIQLDAAEIFDDELSSPLTCQEFDIPIVTPTPVPPTPVKAQPQYDCHGYPIRATSVESESGRVQAHPQYDCHGYPIRVIPVKSQAEPVGGPQVEYDLDDASGSELSDSEAPAERQSAAADTAMDARIRRFVQDYCKAAATRYVDAICLYVIERRLFKKCDVRVNDWFMEDKSALTRIKESAQASSLRETLPAKIDSLRQALMLL